MRAKRLEVKRLASRHTINPVRRRPDDGCPRLKKREEASRKTAARKARGKARSAAGWPGRIPHDFRRTAVRNLVRATVPERVTVQLTGHKARAAFER